MCKSIENLYFLAKQMIGLEARSQENEKMLPTMTACSFIYAFGTKEGI